MYSQNLKSSFDISTNSVNSSDISTNKKVYFPFRNVSETEWVYFWKLK